MKDYSDADWQRLGRWVKRQRMRLPAYREMSEWAEIVSRTPRTLQGLERGEQVGIKTLEAVAERLGVDTNVLLDVLDGNEGADALPFIATAEQRLEMLEGRMQQLEDRFDSLGELIGLMNEYARATREKVHAQPPPLSPVDDAAVPEDLDLAARRPGQESAGKAARRAQDEAGEESQE